MSQGYFLIALGQRYIDECCLLANTIRKSGDQRPISLLIHGKDKVYAREKDIFDQLIEFEPVSGLFKECQTDFEKYCLYPRINFDYYIPYDQNIIVDSDVLCQWNPEHVWNYCSMNKVGIVMQGRINDPNWHWGTVEEVSREVGKHVSHVHGGFFYLRKTGFLEDFFNCAKHVFYNYDKYKCKRYFRGGRVDEILFAVTYAHYGIEPVEFDEYPIMTFNYTSDIQIPSKLQTEGGQNKEMNDYPPFIHMFDKMEGNEFKTLYGKIMNV